MGHSDFVATLSLCVTNHLTLVGSHIPFQLLNIQFDTWTVYCRLSCAHETSNHCTAMKLIQTDCQGIDMSYVFNQFFYQLYVSYIGFIQNYQNAIRVYSVRVNLSHDLK